MRISKGVTPQGGWKFKEGEYWIYGDSFDDLVVTLISHRKSNKMWVGNPEKDIEDQLLGLFPSLEVNICKMISNGR